MTASQLRRYFEQVVELPPSERTARLEDLCPDPGLRRQLEELLAADQAVHEVLDHPLLQAETSLAGTTFGSFRILGLLGRGGMGAVYEAEQIEPPRTVALKVLHGGLADGDRLARFRREAALLARLEHPGIVRLYEVGSCEVGGQPVPYLALELVRDAETVTEHAARTALPVRQRLELFARICDAVGFGHEHGVVHRDLKPGNILVDAEGRPHIVDFGIARALDADSSLATMTGTNQLVGTPSYMSPEQLRPGSRPIDLRSDVWALGVVLYELLTGHHPFAAPGDSLTEIARAIEEREPMRLGRHVAELRGDLEIIVECALRKAPAERYASAAEIGAEIGRVLANEPIAARRDHAIYVLRKRMARHRLLLAAAGAIVVCLTAAALSTSVLWRQAAEAHAASERNLYFSRIAQAANSFEAGRFAEMKQALRECDEGGRDWEWGHLMARSDDAVWHTPFASDTTPAGGDASRNTVNSLAVASDGALVAVAHRNCLIRLLDAKDGRPLRELRGHGSIVSAVAFLPGAPVRLLSASVDKTVRCWDVEAGTVLREWRHEDEVWEIVAAADGSWFATGDRRGFLRIMDAANGSIRHDGLAHRGGVTAMARSPDARCIATAGYDFTIAIWDAGSGELVRRIEKSMQRQRNGSRDILVHAQAITGLAFHPTGHFLFSASQDGFGKMWDVATGDLMFFESMGRVLGEMAVSPDGETLGIGGSDVVRLRHTVEGRALEPMRGHDTSGGAIAFAPNNTLVFAAADDGSVRAFDRMRRGGAHYFARHATKVWGLALSEDRSTLASCDEAGTVKVFGASALTLLRSFPAHRVRIRTIALNDDGSRLLTAGDDRFVRLWDLQSGEQLAEAKTPDRPLVAWRGRTILLASTANDVLVLGHTDLAELRRLPLGAAASALAISRDGLVATGSSKGTIALWEPATATRVAEWSGHDGARVGTLEFLGDGGLASSGADTMVRTWSVPSGALRASAAICYGVRIAESPSRERLLVCPMRDNPRVLLRENLKPVIELIGHEPGSFVCGIVSLGDGRFVTGDSVGALRVWTDQPLQPR